MRQLSHSTVIASAASLPCSRTLGDHESDCIADVTCLLPGQTGYGGTSMTVSGSSTVQGSGPRSEVFGPGQNQAYTPHFPPPLLRRCESERERGVSVRPQRAVSRVAQYRQHNGHGRVIGDRPPCEIPIGQRQNSPLASQALHRTTLVLPDQVTNLADNQQDRCKLD